MGDHFRRIGVFARGGLQSILFLGPVPSCYAERRSDQWQIVHTLLLGDIGY
jgi:hypothetical protein